MSEHKQLLNDELERERQASAEAALRTGKMTVLFLEEDVWIVRSRDRHYTVQREADAWRCNCPDFSARGERLDLLCKHIWAVRLLFDQAVIGNQNEQKEQLDMSYHTLILVGRLGADPQLRYLPSGQFVTHFTVATHFYTNDEAGKPVQETTWFRVSAWGKTGQQCQLYLRKGSAVLVEGRLVADPGTGGPRAFHRSDGSAGCAFEVSAQAVRFLSNPGYSLAGREDEPVQDPEQADRKGAKHE